MNGSCSKSAFVPPNKSIDSVSWCFGAGQVRKFRIGSSGATVVMWLKDAAICPSVFSAFILPKRWQFEVGLLKMSFFGWLRDDVVYFYIWVFLSQHSEKC